ncbi:hemicentin-1-like isoform X7 [Penaeus japonicus]|uniref:hemicentin-1-like isoform X7 n=1 Tax=Penaeus japonicus TaxID=27405 RepID=UPI001C715B14|nr:hemicentin-1-like isoform X7 [Penaeus japonicus]
MFVKLLTLWVVLATTTAFIPDEGVVRRYEVEGLAGESVHLPCEVDKASCGNFHNIKWYKGVERVFIFSDMANVRRAEGPLLDRTHFHYAANGTDSSLQIFPLRTEDEGMYKCEITYLAVRDSCSVVQFVNLTTYALPTYQRLSFEDGSPIDNGTEIGPFDEDTTLTLVCESGGGKPVAKVTWWNGSQALAGKYSETFDEDGSGLGRNVLQVSLTRDDLGSVFTCEAENAAMTSPFVASVTVDVNVPPLSMDVTGAEEAVLEGETVTLLCEVRGARPPATITWMNGTVPVEEAPTVVNVQEESVEIRLDDNTYKTQSQLTFEATRFENGQRFSYEATNSVLENRNEQPMKTEVALDVHYAPVVRVSPENITVNESMDILVFCQYDANPPELTHVYWYQDTSQVDVAGSPEKYGNGNVDHPSLLIKNSSASDMGDYTCRVANKIGSSEVINMASVSVQFRPQVHVFMEPSEPVSEEARLNVTLICDVVRANPEFLVRVRWYLDGELLKELPECYGNNSLYDRDSDLCGIDPSRLLLENVYRDFQGNYSCEGMNDAGWGARSNEAELVVHYPPGKATIAYRPPMAVKGISLELTCSVQDPGQPEATEFIWYRGAHRVPDETSATWIIDPVSLETEDEFTCIPVNSEGAGENATTSIDVLAAPVFIERLPPYYGALMNAEEVSLSCRVECSPLCAIEWFKEDVPLHNDTYYIIRTETIPPNPSSGDLESVRSFLTWRMNRWPEGVLDREQDNANYTCSSTPNVAGPAVSSRTYFRVEYPPEEIIVSDTFIQVVEGEVPPKIECRASSYPEATYVWFHGEEAVSSNAVLNTDYPIERNRAGEYMCVARNRHGEMSASTTFDVLFKPECKIDREDRGSGEDAEILLMCRASANPEDVVFRWRLLNETLTEHVTSKGLTSYLRLPATAESRGTYYCYVNNTVGESIPCEIDVTGVAGIIEKLGDDKIITISAIVAAVVVLVLIICVVIIVICRRQRQAGKFNGAGSLPDREKQGGRGTQPRPGAKGSPLLSDLERASPQHRVSFDSTATNAQDPEPSKTPTAGPKDNGVPSPPDEDKQTFYENLPFHGMQPPPNKQDAPDATLTAGGGSRPPSQLSQQASSGYGSTRSRKDVNLNQSCSEEGSKGKRHDVSFQQDVEDSSGGFSRLRRQNSESYGSMRSTSEKSAKSALARTAAYFSMRLPGAAKRKQRKKSQGEENHQMIDKQKPIKAVPSRDSTASTTPLKGSDDAAPPASSPEQQTTHFSTESKHSVTSQPTNSTVIVESSQTSKLTVVTRPFSRAESNNNSIYNESSPHPSVLRPARSTKVSHQEPSSDPRTGDVTGSTDTLPTPAPRNGGGGKQKHTYQNIPLPAKDKSKNGQPAQQDLSENRKTASYVSSQHQNPTPSSSSSSSSPSSYHYQPQYQQHYQRQPSLYKQYPSSSSINQSHPSYSSSRQPYSSSTYPHSSESQSHATSYPSTQSHPATSYPSSQSHPATSYLNTQSSYPSKSQSHLPKYAPGVVYADLALSRNGHPHSYRRDLNTEYAILQFNGPIVGQEIDV